MKNQENRVKKLARGVVAFLAPVFCCFGGGSENYLFFFMPELSKYRMGEEEKRKRDKRVDN